MPDCVCAHDEVDGRHYVHWIYQIFSDCVYSDLEISAFFVGYVRLSILPKNKHNDWLKACPGGSAVVAAPFSMHPALTHAACPPQHV